MADTSRARHLGRRATLRSGLPSTLALPKFITTDEIEAIRQLKVERPDLPWEDCLRRVIEASKKEDAPEEGDASS